MPIRGMYDTWISPQRRELLLPPPLPAAAAPAGPRHGPQRPWPPPLVASPVREVGGWRRVTAQKRVGHQQTL